MDNDRLKVGLIAPKKPYYFLTTKVPGTEEYQINRSLPKEVLTALGKSRRDTIAEKMNQRRPMVKLVELTVHRN